MKRIFQPAPGCPLWLSLLLESLCVMPLVLFSLLDLSRGQYERTTGLISRTSTEPYWTLTSYRSGSKSNKYTIVQLDLRAGGLIILVHMDTFGGPATLEPAASVMSQQLHA